MTVNASDHAAFSVWQQQGKRVKVVAEKLGNFDESGCVNTHHTRWGKTHLALILADQVPQLPASKALWFIFKIRAAFTIDRFTLGA